METTKTVPYLKRLDTNEGTRQNPHLLYVTHGGKKESYIFHYKEENLCYQYRVYSVRKDSVLLMCIYTRNSRSMKCPAKLTIKPKRNNLIYAKEMGGRNRFYVDFSIAINENSHDDWSPIIGLWLIQMKKNIQIIAQIKFHFVLESINNI